MAPEIHKPANEHLPTPEPAPLAEPRMIRSEDLLGSDKEVMIVHENQLYRLRRTRNGKLILQK
jgi:hemin uptake protein HemP